MSAPDLFADFDPVAVDRIATGFGRILLAAARLVAVERAVGELAAADNDDHPEGVDDVLWAGLLKLNLTNVAAAIVHDHTDEEQDEQLLEGAIAFLRLTVADLRSGS